MFAAVGPGPFPGVIDMFGTAGGLTEFRAALLASRGFAALALAYFAYEDLPAKFEFNLEYFEVSRLLLLSLNLFIFLVIQKWLLCGGRMVKALDPRSWGLGFNSRSAGHVYKPCSSFEFTLHLSTQQ